MYITNSGAHSVRKVTASTGIITALTGTGSSGFSGDNGAATSATLNSPWGIALDAAGTYLVIYFPSQLTTLFFLLLSR